MNQKQRFDVILGHLKAHGELSVEEAMELLDASPATVRRDFKILSEDNKVEKTWGGVRKPNGLMDMMPSLDHRSSIAPEEKKRIAQKSCEMISDGDIVIIDGGTTTVEMTPYLVSKRIRVITNSLLIAQKIHISRKSLDGPEVILLGGLMYAQAGLVVGPQTVANLSTYNANWAFLSVGGLSDGSATNSNQLVVETEKEMIRQAEKSVIMADYTKIGKRSLCNMCQLNDIDYLITNEVADGEHDLNQLDVDPGKLILV